VAATKVVTRGITGCMKFFPLVLEGAYRLEIDARSDSRGFFARTYCRTEFREHGLNPAVVQSSISFSARRGTLRGMHLQLFPHEETKIVRCTAGSIYDVLLDLRPNSSTFRSWVAVELTASNRNAAYIPQGVAHGFQTLTDNTEVLYGMSCEYHEEAAIGVAWNDPAFGIDWPIADPILSERDRSYPFVDAIRSVTPSREQ
jgi:dTDP-4-dehydrorhamnose 3,5-epimerase